MPAEDDLLKAFMGGGSQSSGSADINAFNRTVAENNLWRQGAAPILGMKFDTSTWTPGQTLATGMGQAFLGSILSAIGQREEAVQAEKAAAVLPQLYEDPTSVVTPEGVDRGAFATLKMNSIREAAKRKFSQQDQNADIKNSIARQLFSQRPDLAMRELGIKDIVQPEAPLEVSAPVAGGMSLDLQPESVEAKFNRIYKQQRALGVPGGAAADAAMKLLESDRLLMKGDVQDLEKKREKLSKLDNLIDTAEVAIKGAGETGGPLGGIRNIASAVYSLAPTAGGAVERQQRAAEKQLASLAPDTLSIAKEAGTGALSDKDMQVYLGSGVSGENTPLENKAILEKLKNIRDVGREYTDFREWYRTKYNSLTGAAQKWEEYKRENPIVIDGEWNKNRDSWQSFVLGESKPKESRAVSSDRDAMRAEAQALRAAGRSKSEIAAALRAKYGG
jgi:hypothetical protein